MQFDNTTKSNRQHDCKNSPVLVESAGAQTAPGRKAGGVVLTQHTPGPWHIVSAADPIEKTIMFSFGGFVGDGDNAPIATTCTSSYSDELRPAVALANARLIAAAPDLLDALDELLSSIGLNAVGWPETEDAMRNARAAIAKAKGGAA